MSERDRVQQNWVAAKGLISMMGETLSRRIQLELRGHEPIVGQRMSIWDWNMEAELAKIVPVTSGQIPDKAESNLLCVTLL